MLNLYLFLLIDSAQLVYRANIQDQEKGKIKHINQTKSRMLDRRREHRGGRVGIVVAAGALCSTDLLRAPEQSSSTDHSRRVPTAV